MSQNKEERKDLSSPTGGQGLSFIATMPFAAGATVLAR
jgi:hypothetical protein